MLELRHLVSSFNFLLGRGFKREALGRYFNQEVPLYLRVKVTLACTKCKQRNYDTTKSKTNNPDRLEMNKYCRFCREHTAHKETK